MNLHIPYSAHAQHKANRCKHWFQYNSGHGLKDPKHKKQDWLKYTAALSRKECADVMNMDDYLSEQILRFTSATKLHLFLKAKTWLMCK